MITPKQREALKRIADCEFYPSLVKEEDGWHARWLPDIPWLDEYVRTAAKTPLTVHAETRHYETLHDAWIAALRSETGLVRWDDAECAAFADELRVWSGADEEDGRSQLVFAYSAEGAKGPFGISLPIPHGRAALKALGQAVSVWGVLRELRRNGSRGARTLPPSGEKLSVSLSRADAEDFLRRGARDLVQAGYRVTGVPDLAAVTISAEVSDDSSVSGRARSPVSAEAEPSSRSESPERCAPQSAGKVKLVVHVAGQAVSADEIRFLLEQGGSFVFFRDHWIEVDRSILKEALRALERAGETKASALTFALGLGAIGRLDVPNVTLSGGIGTLLADLVRSARDSRARPPTPVPGLSASLRDYQARGVRWLNYLTDRGFGALLADDMGLGKTVQAIAWLLSRRASVGPDVPIGPRPALIVAPLTLLSNWAHELKTFAPTLKVYIHQGTERHVASGFRRASLAADVVVTSYNLLVKDHALFADVAWRDVVVDEAQRIKNPDTQMARALRAIAPEGRVALTGTPIENSVADLWSLEEFLNPGLLGDRKSFDDRFVKPLSSDPKSGVGKRLAHALEPFILRRLKTDPAIALELGAKRSVREYCELLPRARADYETALAGYRRSEHRQGDVFALLTALKLACDGVVGEDVSGLAESGKGQRLVELLESIFAAGESALVFTQYVKVGRAIRRLLGSRFGEVPPFLHGELTSAERDREVKRFMSSEKPMAFILSLRAGGYGLNLTKATHVIHFDRWWNPAVEDQATDRAHRIGQEKDVLVHEFITPGTLEERIDDILLRKVSLEGLVKDGDLLERTVRLVQ